MSVPPVELPHQNLVKMFLAQAACYSSRPALLTKKEGRYHPIAWLEFKQNVERIGISLLKLGVEKGDRVGLLSENRPEWAYADFAILGIGAANVPIYPTSSANDISYIIGHAKPKILFVSNAEQLNKVISILPQHVFLKHIITFDSPDVTHAKVMQWDKFLECSGLSGEARAKTFQQSVDQVRANDLATIIYTSGTTGPPKGVMLTHANFLWNCVDSKKSIHMNDRDVTLSFLPLSHVFERMAGFYFPIMCGATIAYAENMNTVPQNLLEVRPSVACAVPRVYEKVYARVAEAIEHSPPLLQKFTTWAIEIGHRTIPFRLEGKPLPILLYISYQLVKALVFRKLQKQLGGRLRFFISGGAPLPKKLGEFFFAAGIYILEGYGLTETSPVISVNRVDRLRFGTVGIPLEHVEARIANDGEIVVRGPSVMAGYYQNPAATAEVIHDGWFHTGDIGEFDSDGFLKITDRKKDIIVTSGGKNISPQNIENLILRSRAVQQVVVIGDRHNYLVALVVPNFNFLAEYFGMKNCSNQEISKDSSVCELIRQEIDRGTLELSNYEKIKYFRLLSNELTQEKGELTPTLKVKRKIVNEHYVHFIQEMYAEGEERKHP